MQNLYELIVEPAFYKAHMKSNAVIAEVYIGIKSTSAKYYFEQDGLVVRSLGDVPIGIAYEATKASLALRDKVFRETSRRLWGVKIRKEVGMDALAELDFEKPEDHTYDDSKEWQQYLELEGLK